jgi:hypothetical protein
MLRNYENLICAQMQSGATFMATTCTVDVLVDGFTLTYGLSCPGGCPKGTQQNLIITSGIQNLKWIPNS